MRIPLILILFLISISEGLAQSKGKKDPLEDSVLVCLSTKQVPRLLIFSEAWKEKMKKKKGENSLDYAKALQTYGDALRWSGNWKEAETILFKCLEIKKNRLGEMHTEVAHTHFSLGQVFTNTGNPVEAEVHFRKCLNIRQDSLPKNHPDLASLYLSLGSFFYRTGNNQDAEKFYLNALEINGKDNDLVANCYNGLAALYSDLGDFEKAESNLLNAISIWKKINGEKHKSLAYPYNNLANLYEKIGSFSKAESYFLKTIEIWELEYGQINADLADFYNNLGVLYFEMKAISKAEACLLKALDIKRKLLREEEPELAATYLNLGTFYFETGSFRKADLYNQKSLEIYSKNLGQDHPDLALIHGNQANLAMRFGNHQQAEFHYKKAIDIAQKSLGNDHPFFAINYSRLGVAYLVAGAPEKAENQFREYQKRELSALVRYFPFLSDAEKENYIQKQKPYLNIFQAFCIHRQAGNPGITSELFNQQLATKGILLQSSAKWRQRIKNSSDKETLALFEEWTEIQNQINLLYQSSDLSAKSGLDSIVAKSEAIEKELSLRSENFVRLSDRKMVVWQDVQKKLKRGEAAVEMIRIQKFGVEQMLTDTTDEQKPAYRIMGVSDTILYAALIIKPESRFPELVVLKNGNELEAKYFRNYKKCIRKQLPDKESYSLFWKNIGDKLQNIRTIFFSPDGIFHQLNLNTLQNPTTGKYLLEEKDLRILTVTKDLLDDEKPAPGNTESLLVGFPEFQRKSPQGDSVAKPENQSGSRLSLAADLIELPETKIEIERVALILKSKGWKVKDLTGQNATEENLKNANRPRLLHVATHGFFNQDSGRGQNPLLNSGLMLSGAGSTLKGISSGGMENGILTSSEAMNLNLDQTDLVVLSACETGLGEIKNGEGVYGLQRAFKVAGARSIIMSLWKVSDKPTQELMVSFYQNWLQLFERSNIAGGSKRMAFLKAQKELKIKYPNPFYWGAFVMVGE